MSKKVFLIGASKTGTTSICKALSILEYKTIHYMDPINYIEDLLTKEDYDWGWVKDWDAVGDIPIPKYFKELDRLFPNSKFILSVRNDTEKWLSSCEHQIEEVVPKTAGRHVQRVLDKMIIDHHSVIRSLVYGSTHFNAKRYTQVYSEHLSSVAKYFDDRFEDLLIFDLFDQKHGWKELCEFLGKDIPNKPFPHLGKRK